MSLPETKDAAQTLTAHPDSPTRLAFIAHSLLADTTVSNGFRNSEPIVKVINLDTTALVELFTNQLQPLIYANARQLSLYGAQNANDTNELDAIIYTLAIGATKAARTTAFMKAKPFLSNLGALFGTHPDNEKYRYPAATTLLISSLGPVVSERLSYRCEFIPCITQQDIDALYNDARYSVLHERNAAFILKQIPTWVTCTDVNVEETISSPWWMLHIVPSKHNKGLRTCNNAYLPVSFNDIDNAICIAAISMDTTLYEFPAMCHTAKVGPFVTKTNASDFEDIPLRLRNDLTINESPPVMLYQFKHVRNATNADLIFEYLFDQTLNDILSPCPDIFCNTEAETKKVNADTEHAVQQFVKAHKSQTKAASPDKQAKKRAKTPVSFIPPENPNYPKLDDEAYGAEYSVFFAEIYYFDHQILKDFRIATRNQIILSANH
jgi:hypothetical protein